MSRAHLLACLGAVPLWLVGCGGTNVPPVDTTPLVTISGTVTVQGKPFAGNGYVVGIVPAKGSGGTSLDIGKDGKYSGSVPAGEAVLAVVSPDKFGQMHGSPDVATSSDGKKTETLAEGKVVDIELSSMPPKLATPKPRPAGHGHSQ